MTRSGGRSATARSAAASPLPTIDACDLARSLERVLDQRRDVLFVFDDQHAAWSRRRSGGHGDVAGAGLSRSRCRFIIRPA